MPISIFVTAYNAHDYIKDCLDSIAAQTYFEEFNEYEVLLGIDGCRETYDKVMEIRDNYDNLKVFYMLENMGTYVTSNTLISQARYNNLLRFDSDDVMLPNMIDLVSRFFPLGDAVVMRCREANENLSLIGKVAYCDGIVAFKRQLIDMLGGYLPWRCAADSELLGRIIRYGKLVACQYPVFVRRRHSDSLTSHTEVGMVSEYRRQKKVWITNNPERAAYVEPLTGAFVEV